MAELFNTAPEFKSALGGAVNASFDLKSVEPYVYQTARKYLTDILSQDFYDELVAAHTGSPNAAQTMLIPYVQRALAWLTMYEYFPGRSRANVGFGIDSLRK